MTSNERDIVSDEVKRQVIVMTKKKAVWEMIRGVVVCVASATILWEYFGAIVGIAWFVIGTTVVVYSVIKERRVER